VLFPLGGFGGGHRLRMLAAVRGPIYDGRHPLSVYPPSTDRVRVSPSSALGAAEEDVGQIGGLCSASRRRNQLVERFTVDRIARTRLRLFEKAAGDRISGLTRRVTGVAASPFPW